MKKLAVLLAGVGGFAAGGLVGYFLTKKHYEEVMDSKVAEETKSVMESSMNQVKHFRDRYESIEKEYAAIKAGNVSDVKKPPLNEYIKRIQEVGKEIEEEEEPEEIEDEEDSIPFKVFGVPARDLKEDGPILIKESEFGEDDNYEIVEMIFYSDGVLAYTNSHENDVIDPEKIPMLIGDALDHFTKDGISYVKNDLLRCYYEIYQEDYPYEED